MGFFGGMSAVSFVSYLLYPNREEQLSLSIHLLHVTEQVSIAAPHSQFLWENEEFYFSCYLHGSHSIPSIIFTALLQSLHFYSTPIDTGRPELQPLLKVWMNLKFQTADIHFWFLPIWNFCRMIWCNSQKLILHTEGEFGPHDLAWDEYCSPCPNAGSTYLHYCFTCHLPRGMQDLPAGLQSYFPSHHSDSLGAVSNPPCLFTEPFSQVSNKYVHEHSPKQYSTGDLPLMARGDHFHLPFISYHPTF